MGSSEATRHISVKVVHGTKRTADNYADAATTVTPTDGVCGQDGSLGLSDAAGSCCSGTPMGYSDWCVTGAPSKPNARTIQL